MQIILEKPNQSHLNNKNNKDLILSLVQFSNGYSDSLKILSTNQLLNIWDPISPDFYSTSTIRVFITIHLLMAYFSVRETMLKMSKQGKRRSLKAF